MAPTESGEAAEDKTGQHSIITDLPTRVGLRTDLTGSETLSKQHMNNAVRGITLSARFQWTTTINQRYHKSLQQTMHRLNYRPP